MQTFEYRRVSISDLLLDVKNPRHEDQADELSALQVFFANQSGKIMKLLKDIVAEGTNPADLPIVTAAEHDPQKFVVLEGNRRLIALRLLADPGMAELAGRPALKRTIETLSKQLGPDRPDSLQCVVFLNREEAGHWIKLRHTGMNEGAGIVGWDALQVARFNKTQYRTALKVIDHIRHQVPIDDELRRQISRISLSNVARLVNDPDLRNAIALRIENGKLITDLNTEDLNRALLRIVTDVATKKITVDDIKKKADRERYIETLVKDKIAPSSTSMRVEPYEIGTGAATSKEKRGRPASTSRKFLIAPNCVLRIKHPRINEIYRELRRLDVEAFTNCGAVMLRVFLELSLDEYAGVKKIPLKARKGRTKIELSDKILSVAGFLDDNNILTRGQLSFMRAAARTRNDLFSASMLHAYVHNRHLSPKATDLKITWDNMQSFMEALWPS